MDATPEVASEPLRVNEVAETRQPLVPSGEAGLIVIEVDGLTVSTLIVEVVVALSVFPALSSDQ